MVAAVIVLAFVVSRSCQQSEIQLTQEQAIAKAREKISFTPEDTQIRLLRQGINRQPFWIVSLSIPRGELEDVFKRLALVRIDATTGEVVEVSEQKRAKKRQEAQDEGGG